MREVREMLERLNRMFRSPFAEVFVMFLIGVTIMVFAPGPRERELGAGVVVFSALLYLLFLRLEGDKTDYDDLE